MNTMSTKYPFPTTAPGSAATITLLALTGKGASDARRLVISINSSADSGASGVAFTALLDGGTLYRSWTAYTYATASGMTIYDVAVPVGVVGIKVTYTNSAAVLTTWEGSVSALYDERAAA